MRGRGHGAVSLQQPLGGLAGGQTGSTVMGSGWVSEEPASVPVSAGLAVWFPSRAFKDPGEPRHPCLPRQRSDTKVSVTPRETSLGTRHLMASITCVRPLRGPVRRDSVSHEFPWRLLKTQRDAGALSSYVSILFGSDFSTCFWRLLGSPNQASFSRWMFALPSQGGSTKDR